MLRHALRAHSRPYTPRRYLNLHEHHSKQLMASFAVRVQRGKVANTPLEAELCAKAIQQDKPNAELVVKSQILAGGRGKGIFDTGFKGGVKVCTKPLEIRDYAEKMLGNRLITAQTGPEGQLVSKVLVHEGINFEKEYYLAFLMDRAYGGPVIVTSPMGGMDIEAVAEEHPDQIHIIPVDIKKGISDEHTAEVCKILGVDEAVVLDMQQQIKNLYSLFLSCDATQVEINPFVVATDGKVYCVDAKITFDENAEFRQGNIFSWRDWSMEDAREVEAAKSQLNYVGLDGNIGCMVNGAGLAMATMDIIKLHGGQPANFLDVGGGATAKQVAEAFRILTSDSNVKAILVNIFGGIMKCDVIAEGIVEAAKTVSLKVPLVVRLEGTNVEKGTEILKKSGLNIISGSDLDDAAMKAVAAISQ